MRKIRLALDHTNRDGKHYAGNVVELNDEEAEWVVNQTGAFRLAAEEKKRESLLAPVEPLDVLK